jgi:hypothetical protein
VGDARDASALAISDARLRIWMTTVEPSGRGAGIKVGITARRRSRLVKSVPLAGPAGDGDIIGCQ